MKAIFEELKAAKASGVQKIHIEYDSLAVFRFLQEESKPLWMVHNVIRNNHILLGKFLNYKWMQEQFCLYVI